MDTKALRSISHSVYVLGVRTPFGFGGCTVDVVAQVGAGDVPLVMLASQIGNYSNAMIKEYGEFTLSVLPKDVAPSVIASFGYRSSRDGEDKWAVVPHTFKDGLPYVDGAVAYMRLRVTDSRETDTHTVFYAELVDSWVGTNAPPLLYAEYQSDLKDATRAAFRELKPPKAKTSWVCRLCGHIYGGEIPFPELPDDWKCPLCGAAKSEFDEVAEV
ncbi:MAG: flavin reductase [Oscillospiraceae bacterium]|jgi:flavin reductase (DIM6/NTAB) family NADH-FMN oxidoreductase RutF/rubredoxin|nr:flavin reductase [Oscillospiraceae bacterium]